MIIGIDEVGRGAWAGPLLVVAASGTPPATINDSKKLTRRQRQAFLEQLLNTCSFGEGWVTSSEIDMYGLAEAMKIAVARALSGIGATEKDTIIMDGNINYCDPRFTNVQTVIKADALHPIVSAASVYAKQKRDTYMVSLDEVYANYGFASHVGYGTRTHKQAIEQYGLTEQHRRSFKPIRVLL